MGRTTFLGNEVKYRMKRPRNVAWLVIWTQLLWICYQLQYQLDHSDSSSSSCCHSSISSGSSSSGGGSSCSGGSRKWISDLDAQGRSMTHPVFISSGTA